MRIFLDSANVEELRQAVAWGAVDGVTTNPTLVAKTGRDVAELLQDICSIVDGPVSAETVSTDAAGIVEEGRVLAAVHANIVVKVPMTKAGLAAARQLSRDGMQTNVTLCVTANQALLAAKAGATYVSPFVGRLDDINQTGMDLIRDIRLIYDNYGLSTKILVASIRTPVHVLEAARIGADAATMPFGVLEQLIRHPLTDAGLERFLADWSKVPEADRGPLRRDRDGRLLAGTRVPERTSSEALIR